MEFKNLATFRTIVETGSFTAAAEKLNYTQSTITFQISQLEQELSAKLFEKVGRKMVLTAAGESLIPYVEEIFQSVNRLHYFERDLAECQGSLRIGVAETFLSYKLPPILKEFVRQAPKAKLFIQSMNCYDIRNALVTGDLDVGIFYQDVGGLGDSLTVYPLASYPVTLIASPNTAARFSDFFSPSQQLPIPLIINEPNCIFRQIFEGYLRGRAILLDHTIELGSIQTIKQMVVNDVGISFLPRFVVKEELKNGQLVEIPTGVEHAELTIACAHHKNKWISPLLRLFLDCLNQAELAESSAK